VHVGCNTHAEFPANFTDQILPDIFTEGRSQLVAKIDDVLVVGCHFSVPFFRLDRQKGGD
jgi:hypothetical protein